MSNIKFGTDGWRAVLGEQFTEENVIRVTLGVIEFLKSNFEESKVVVGFDCRIGGEFFAQTVAKVLDKSGVEVVYHEKPITTPAISYATVALNASLGIILTASHNPPNYNGYKLKGSYGGPLLPDQIKEVEALIPDEPSIELNNYRTERTYVADLNELYCERVRESFDLERINKSGIKIAYDAMYGSGQFVVKKLLPYVRQFRCKWVKHFNGLSPEPILKNLGDFQQFLKDKPGIDFALVNDGDADRIGLMDGDGNFIDSHHIMLLLVHYLHKYKGQSGKVATGFSTTTKLHKYCEIHNLPLEVVPIGFKHICGLMIEEDILMGGEESGGIAVSGHIPERDGIWIGLVLLQFMTETSKSLNELIAEVKEIVGDFFYKRIDLKIDEQLKLDIVENCTKGVYQSFGNLKVERIEDMDGFKYWFNDDEWLMIRPSGTEPVLRTYAEGVSELRAQEILDACHAEILN